MIKRCISVLSALSIVFGGLTSISFAQSADVIFEQDFNNAESDNIANVSGYNLDKHSAEMTMTEGGYFKKDSDKILKITMSSFNADEQGPGVYISTSENEEYATDSSYYMQTAVYIPDDIKNSVRIDAGAELGQGKAEYSQFFCSNGELRKAAATATSNTYIKGGWNLVTMSLERVSAASYKYRLYVNGMCNYHNYLIEIDEGSTIKNVFMRFSYVNDSEESAEQSFLVDDIVFGKNLSPNDIYQGYLAEDVKSDKYEIKDNDVSGIPDNITVEEFIADLSDYKEVYAADTDGNEVTGSIGVDEAKYMVTINELGRIRVRKINLAKTVDGVIIPTEDYEEDAYNSEAWNVDSGLNGKNDGDVLFRTEKGEVVEGKGNSPYTVGGFWHVAFNQYTPDESITVMKETVDNLGYYRFKSSNTGSEIAVRGQGANLDTGKMQMGKKTVVEFICKPNEYSLFNVSFRWNVDGTVMSDDALLGTLYETECITFSDDGKIYLGGIRNNIDPTVAVCVGEYEPGKSYKVSSVMEIVSENIIRVKELYINGEKTAENKDFYAKHTGIKNLAEVDMYMKAAGADKSYDVSVSGMKCYTTDDFADLETVTPQNTKITVNGKDYILLDALENGFYVLSDGFFGKEKFDSNPDRNHITLAKAEFDIEDEFNIAYKLNDVSNNDSAVNKLNGDFNNLLSEKKWSGNQLAKVGLLSKAEAGKYSGKIGGNGEKSDSWWLIDKADGSEHDVICINNANPKMLINRKAHGKMYVRPAFVVDFDFFGNNKIDYIGKEAAKLFDKQYTRDELIAAGYTVDDINAFFERPTVKNISVSGKTIVGEKLNADYEWVSDYDDTNSNILWYCSDTADGTYTQIPNVSGKEMTITSDLAGKYIKAAVVPVSDSNINPTGELVLADKSTNIVYDNTKINEMLKEINDADSSKLLDVLTKYNDFLALNLSYDTDIMNMAMGILSNENIESLSELQNLYGASITLTKLNKTEKENIESFIKDTSLMLDLSSYDTFTQEQKNEVIDSLYNKNFTSYSEFEKIFNEKVILIEFNSANREQLYNLLKKHKDSFTANIDNLTDYQIRQTAARIEGVRASFTELDTAITNAVNDVLNNSDSNTGTGGSGGGGGGGGGSTANKKDNSSGMVMSPIVSEKPEPIKEKYSDLETVPWAVSVINELSEMGIISGTGDGRFLPDKNITREEFVKMIVLAFNLEGESDVEFIDVDKSQWYFPYISKAVAAGVISGYDDGRFGIGDEITREDAAVMLYRIIKDKMPALEAYARFTDQHKASGYAQEALMAFYNAAIIEGDGSGNLNPKSQTTRAMAAKILYLAMNCAQK